MFSVVYIFSTRHTSFPYYNETLPHCYPSLVCFSREWPVLYRLRIFRKEGTDMDMHRDIVKMREFAMQSTWPYNVYRYRLQNMVIHIKAIVSRTVLGGKKWAEH
jgi:hypothetical protein